MAPTRPRSLRALAFGPRRNSSPPSPTFSDTTHASAMNFGADGPEKIITRANLKASLQAYEDLMTTSANYRAALIAMSKVTAAFADAMEVCSGMKGPSYEAGTRLQAASGLHHLIGNHWHVLAETLDKNFERPLRQHLDTYKTIVNERSASYEKALHEKSRIIRQTEMGNMNKKERNLQSFREALNILQRQVDELDDLKAAHYQEIMEHEEEVWNVVQGKVCLEVRSTMDVFDRFTAKSSDPIIEVMLQSVPDPFDSYGPPQAEDQIFSILPPLSIMTNAPSPSPSPLTSTPEREATENLPALPSRNTWLPSSTNGGYFSESTEWADVPSPTPTPPRSVSPPSTLSRKHPASTSALPTHHPRKSESKLRSVLSVIDESRQRDSDAEDVPQTEHNGNPPAADTSWTSFTYGASPYADADVDQTTPRHSVLFSNHSPSPPPGTDPERREPDEAVVSIPLAT